LHGSGNVSTTIIEQILIKYLRCTEVERREWNRK
jgi:hypothetical protein